MVTDAVVGVPLDRIAPQVAEHRPAVEETWVLTDHSGDGVAVARGIGQRSEGRGVRSGKDGLG